MPTFQQQLVCVTQMFFENFTPNILCHGVRYILGRSYFYYFYGFTSHLFLKPKLTHFDVPHFP